MSDGGSQERQKEEAMKNNNTPTTLQRTGHSVRRQQQRGITRELVALALQFGKRYHVGGGRVAYYLGRRHFPQGLTASLADRAEGLLVVLAGDVLVTAYRNTAGFRATRKGFWRRGPSV